MSSYASQSMHWKDALLLPGKLIRYKINYKQGEYQNTNKISKDAPSILSQLLLYSLLTLIIYHS